MFTKERKYLTRNSHCGFTCEPWTRSNASAEHNKTRQLNRPGRPFRAESNGVLLTNRYRAVHVRSQSFLAVVSDTAFKN